jgi:hypothetical protein
MTPHRSEISDNEKLFFPTEPGSVTGINRIGQVRASSRSHEIKAVASETKAKGKLGNPETGDVSQADDVDGKTGGCEEPEKGESGSAS